MRGEAFITQWPNWLPNIFEVRTTRRVWQQDDIQIQFVRYPDFTQSKNGYTASDDVLVAIHICFPYSGVASHQVYHQPGCVALSNCMNSDDALITMVLQVARNYDQPQ